MLGCSKTLLGDILASVYMGVRVSGGMSAHVQHIYGCDGRLQEEMTSAHMYSSNENGGGRVGKLMVSVYNIIIISLTETGHQSY